MKLLLAFASAHAQAWTRNPKTGKVEFRGSLPWPPSVKTEAQQRALVRHWYLARLTEMSAEFIGVADATSKSSPLLTYAGLPKVVVLQQGDGIKSYLVGYIVEFTLDAAKFKYTLTSFDLQRSGMCRM